MEGLKAEKSDAQQATCSAEILENFHTLREICVQLGANFVNQPFNKSQLQVLSCFCSRQIHRSIMTEQEHDERYLAAQLACQKLADDLYQDPH